MEFVNKIRNYQIEYKLTDEECAKKLGVDIEIIKNLDSNASKISKEEQTRILNLIASKQKNKKIINILDLVFRFVAMVMALTALLLSIKETVDTRSLIVLLSIGLVCSSMTILPKIEK